MQGFRSVGAHYRVLGVKRGESWDNIKDAHRQLISKWHPDRFDSNDPGRLEAERRSREINNAIQELEKFKLSETKKLFVRVVPVDLPDQPPAGPRRKRAKTIERVVVVRDGVVYSVKKMRRLKQSAWRELVTRTARGISTFTGKLKRGKANGEANFDDYGIDEVVHFVEGQRSVRRGTYNT